LAVVVALAGALVSAANAQKTVAVAVPLGLLPLEWPKDNPYLAEKVALGRLLYFDKRLSKDDTVSCATAILRSTATPMAPPTLKASRPAR
jgi:cytochrome c peroxidase